MQVVGQLEGCENQTAMILQKLGKPYHKSDKSLFALSRRTGPTNGIVDRLLRNAMDILHSSVGGREGQWVLRTWTSETAHVVSGFRTNTRPRVLKKEVPKKLEVVFFLDVPNLCRALPRFIGCR